MANYTYDNLQDTNKCKKIKKQLENYLKRNPCDYDSALKYYNLGNYDNKLIIKIFNNFIYHKNREEVLFILGKAELAIGNIKEASYHFQTLLNENKSKWEDILFNEGKKELSINNLENASVYFNLLLSNDPKNLDDITFLIKNIKFLQENPPKTKKNLKTILENGYCCDEKRIKLELAKMELNDGHILEANNYLQLLSEEDIKDLETELFNEGKKELSINNLENASIYFKLLLKYKPKNWEDISLELAKIEFKKGNIQEGRKYFENILTNDDSYDKDYIKIELAKAELSCGNIVIAKNYFIELLNSKRWKIAMVCLVKLNIKQNDYISAFKYIKLLKQYTLSDELKFEVDMLSLYIMKELNIFFDKENNIPFNYNNYQVIDYDEFVALEHIIDRHYKDFSRNINIYKLFDKIKDKLIDEYKVRCLKINDIYDIPFQDIGDNCHILRVVTLPNTTNILTMYPLNINIFYLDEEFEKVTNKTYKR